MPTKQDALAQTAIGGREPGLRSDETGSVVGDGQPCATAQRLDCVVTWFPVTMASIQYRVLQSFPEPAFSVLAGEAFGDYEPSSLLTDVLKDEAATKQWQAAPVTDALRVGAFQDEVLVGWTYARAEGSQLQMVNSGVAPAGRRQGVYSRLVQMVLDHAKARGYASVCSRHAANNNAVLIAKLKLGFFVSGFEYSEVYGPLVRLSYLPGTPRRTLHRARSGPLRRQETGTSPE